jgi:hypothetical protein
MFNSGILDVVIGLVVVYLQLSLVCTAVHELIAARLKTRAKELERGLSKLLMSPQLLEKFYGHPLIQGLRPDGQKPSYIPSQTFALTLMDIVRRHSFEGTLASALAAAQKSQDLQLNAQSVYQTANASLKAAQAVRDAANAAMAGLGQSASAAERLDAAKTAQTALNEHAAADAANTDALAKQNAALQALVDALNFQKNLHASVDEAKRTEDAAALAEQALADNPNDETAKQNAAQARAAADAAAALITPSTASLLTEARDKVVGVSEGVVPPELKTALLALLDNAGDNLGKAQTNLEQWFNDAMDRVSGVYKRKSQYVVVAIAVLVTVLANVDSMQIADSLSHDKALRESLVAAAPELAKADEKAVDAERNAGQTTVAPAPTPAPSVTPKTGSQTATQAAATANAAAQATPAASPAATASPTPPLTNIRASWDVLKNLGLPIGYVRVCTAGEDKVIDKCASAIDDYYNAETKLAAADASVSKANAALLTVGANKTAAQAALTKAQAEQDAARKADDQALAFGIAAKQFKPPLPNSTPNPSNPSMVTRVKELVKQETAFRAATAALAKATEDAEKESLKQTGVEQARKDAEDAATALAKAKEDAKKDPSKQSDVANAQAKVDTTAAAFSKAANDAKQAADQQQSVQSARKAVETAAKVVEDARKPFNDEKEKLRANCPRCMKEAGLSQNERKQRLPTTHDHDFFGDSEISLWNLITGGSPWEATKAVVSDSWNLLYSHWLGWLLTVFAISLGAPFWFDTLNRLMVIRSTVKPSEKSQTQESKDNPAGGDGDKENTKK